jgi:hypothetical protein
MTSPLRSHDLVRASEISEYLFLRRSWYLSARGIRPNLVHIERMRYGLAQHRKVLEEIRVARRRAECHISHNRVRRCRSCGFRSLCGESLI